VNRSTACGITRSVVFSTATRAEQVEAINEFIGDTNAAQPGLTGLGTMHPGLSAAAVRSAAGRIRTLGMKGIKLHPDFQELYPDADDMDPIFRSPGQRLGMVFHAGDHRHPYSHRPASLPSQPGTRLPIVGRIGDGANGTCYTFCRSSQCPCDTFEHHADHLRGRNGPLIRIFGATGPVRQRFPMWVPCDELQRFLALP
jgi:hypothetical protein